MPKWEAGFRSTPDGIHGSVFSREEDVRKIDGVRGFDSMSASEDAKQRCVERRYRSASMSWQQRTFHISAFLVLSRMMRWDGTEMVSG